MTRRKKPTEVLNDAAPPPVAEEPQSMTTDEVAEWLTDKPKKREAEVFRDLVALDKTWERKREKFRSLWLEHVEGNVTSKARKAEERKAAKAEEEE